MSKYQFVEAHSSDAFVRQLHRQAVRILGDGTLSRSQVEAQVRQIQHRLRAYLSSLHKAAGGRNEDARSSPHCHAAREQQVLLAVPVHTLSH